MLHFVVFFQNSIQLETVTGSFSFFLSSLTNCLSWYVHHYSVLSSSWKACHLPLLFYPFFTHSCVRSEMKGLWYQGPFVLAVSSCSASCVFKSLFDQMSVSNYNNNSNNIVNNNFNNNIIIK